ncbi:MAG: hypothetical protein WCH05_06615 [Chlorobiaceae bacterium]
MIYTGNFANIKSYVQAGLSPISIARFNRYFRGHGFLKLAPTASMLRLPEDEYTKLFKAYVLGRLNPHEIIKEIEAMSSNPILLCYEKATDFCHRILVREWLQEAGYDCQEYELKSRDAEEPPRSETLGLFD